MAAEANASNSGQTGPVIEKLLDFFVADDGTAYYQVKWKPTWERADALLNFTHLIDTFWKFVNNAHTGNLFNNQAMHKGPVPVLPAPPLAQSINQMNVQTTPKSIVAGSVGPITPKQKKNPIPNLQKLSNTFSSPQNRMLQQQTPPKPPIQTAVIIDSDDEDVAEVTTPSKSVTSSLQNMPLNDTLTSLPMQPQQQYPMQQMWNIPKTEPTDLPDQKPFQGNPPNFNMDFNPQVQMQQMPGSQLPVPQQQFPFPMPNANFNPVPANGRGRGGRGGRARGRGAGDASGTKRKQTLPPGASPNKVPNVKTEIDDMDVQIKEDPGAGDFGSMEGQSGGEGQEGGLAAQNWREYFETMESYVDGQKVSASYKCKVCGSTIAQLGNCSRHFKKHVSDGAGEHECPICGKKFYRIDYIERHLKQHGTGSNEEVQKMIKLIAAGMKKK